MGNMVIIFLALSEILPQLSFGRPKNLHKIPVTVLTHCYGDFAFPANAPYISRKGTLRTNLILLERLQTGNQADRNESD